jgi:two-component system sensor histidine kinase PilS (NtrC family)
MIDKNTNNIILLFRLTLFFIIIILSHFFYFENDKFTQSFINISILITLFSLILFFANNIFNKTLILYLQGVFDFGIISYLVVITGYFESPYVIFYSIIVIYMCFFLGIRGGIFSIFLYLIIFTLFAFIKYPQSRTIGKDYLLNFFQYGVSFSIIMLLTAYLNRIYYKKNEEKIKIEEKFKYLENLYKSILDNIDIGIMLLSKNQLILSCNDAGYNILNLNKGSIIGKKLKSIIEGIKFNDNQFYFKNKYIGYKLQPFNIDKDIKGDLLIFQDITEKEHLKNKLQEQQKLAILGQFSATIAHEIKNPLGAIKGSFQIIKNSKKFDWKLVNVIDREINRLDLILSNFLTIGKDRQDSTEVVNVKKVVEEFVTYISEFELFEELKVNLNIKADFDANISNYELRQILWNLFLNSYQAQNENFIDITLTEDEIFYKLIYTDSGPGIDENIKDKLFKPFFTTKKAGTGLGLYVIKNICDKYHIDIKIWTKNETQNGFKIELLFKK